ncbi:unnamed protein product [Tetraodon nigroviridis]|uniref:(spotted green pufferfish) hypothetical protein n=1 Tax=Tetraodon nigroviridis TaxID=99883 RepID=Q4S5Z5_TETNG|nr:unnamed protein product [Tetraodon nigroviridis]
MREVYLRLRSDWRQEEEWEESELREWERLNTEEGKGEWNQERRRAGMERGVGAGNREQRWD